MITLKSCFPIGSSFYVRSRVNYTIFYFLKIGFWGNENKSTNPQ